MSKDETGSEAYNKEGVIGHRKEKEKTVLNEKTYSTRTTSRYNPVLTP